MKDISIMRCLSIILFLLPRIFATDDASNHRINLEDIERDNIRSEKLAKNSNHKDIFELQQTQNYNSKTLEFYRQQLKELKELQDEKDELEETSTLAPPSSPSPTTKGGVLYATTPSSTYLSYKFESTSPSPNVHSAHLLNQPFSYNIRNYHPTPNYENDPVEYVTIAPKPKYLYQVQDESEKDESSSHTYSSSSSAREPQSSPRQISATVASYLSQPLLYYRRQPHYLQIQSDDDQSKSIQSSSQHVANDIQYAATAPGGNIDAAPVVYSHDEDIPPSKQQPQPQQPQPQQQPNDANDDVQYVPYIAQGPSPQHSYVMMVAIPSTQGQNIQPIRFTPSVITYSHLGPAAITPVVGGLHPNIQYVSTLPSQSTTGPLQYVNTNDLDEAPPAAQYSSQHQDIQYVDPDKTSSRPSTVDGSKQFKYAPKHPEGLPMKDDKYKIEPERLSQFQSQPIAPSYALPQRVVPLSQSFQYAGGISHQQINVQPLYQFQPYREPKSLLDSYVPSWIILQRQQEQQRLLLQQQQQQQQRSFLSQSAATIAPQPYSYDTIAYSTHQHTFPFELTNHVKRSSTILKKVDVETKKTK